MRGNIGVRSKCEISKAEKKMAKISSAGKMANIKIAAQKHGVWRKKRTKGYGMAKSEEIDIKRRSGMAKSSVSAKASANNENK